MTKPKASALIDLVELAPAMPPVEREESHTQVARDIYSANEVGPGKSITLHFSLALETGELIDSCFEKPPASFVIGDGSMLQGFEEKLFGMKVGESCQHLLLAEHAFGELKTANIQRFPRFRFPADLVLTQGLMMDFADVNGGSLTGVVKEFTSAEVSVDFNHPLAGKNITFCAQIVSVGLSE